MTKSYKARARQFFLSLLSRKFLLAFIASAVTFGNFMWNWGLDFNEVLTFMAPILAFIGVEGIADIKSR